MSSHNKRRKFIKFQPKFKEKYCAKCACYTYCRSENI